MCKFLFLLWFPIRHRDADLMFLNVIRTNIIPDVPYGMLVTMCSHLIAVSLADVQHAPGGVDVQVLAMHLIWDDVCDVGRCFQR